MNRLDSYSPESIASIKVPPQIEGVEKRVAFLEKLQKAALIEEESFATKLPLIGPFFQGQQQKKANRLNALFASTLSGWDGEGLLHEAAKRGLGDLALKLIESGTAIDAPLPGTGATPLHSAAYYGHPELVTLLLKKGASIESKSFIREGQESLRRLGGETPLHMAIGQGHLEAARILLERGADKEAENGEKFRPLHYACKRCRGDEGIKIVELLISFECDLNAKSSRGMTPLQLAAMEGPVKLIETLLVAGADPSQTDSEKIPLQPLVEKKRNTLIEELFPHQKEIIDALNREGGEKFLPFFRSHPKGLFLQYINSGKGNPLKLPLLFNDYELAKALKNEMGESLYKSALKEIEKSYPLLSLKPLIDCDLTIDKKTVYRLGGKEPLPPLPPLKLSLLQKIFGCSLELLEGDHTMRIGAVAMPVELQEQNGETLVGLRMELLLAMLERCGLSEEGVEEGLKRLIDAVNLRTPFAGTPKREEPALLEEWYLHVELLIKHLIASELADWGSEGRAHFSIPMLRDLAATGHLCGTSILEEATSLYEIKLSRPKNIEEKILSAIAKYKKGIALSMVPIDARENLHIKNGILQAIDESCGIPDEERANYLHFRDASASAAMDKELIVSTFQNLFTPTALIDLAHELINGKRPEIGPASIIDWFVDNLPEEWDPEKKLRFIAKRVQNQQSGKIKREAIALLLKKLEIVE